MLRVFVEVSLTLGDPLPPLAPNLIIIVGAIGLPLGAFSYVINEDRLRKTYLLAIIGSFFLIFSPSYGDIILNTGLGMVIIVLFYFHLQRAKGESTEQNLVIIYSSAVISYVLFLSLVLYLRYF